MMRLETNICTLLSVAVSYSDGFFHVPVATLSRRFYGFGIHQNPFISKDTKRLFVAFEQHQSNIEDTLEDDMDDETLLKVVAKSKLQELCQQFKLDDHGTKPILLQRLRDYASEQAELDRQTKLSREERIENEENPNVKYEIVYETDDGPDEDDIVGTFYFPTPEAEVTNETKAELKRQKKKQEEEAKENVGVKSPNSYPEQKFLTPGHITAPPPPDEPNEDGERAVTIYDTKDTNDLTGIQAKQPGRSDFADNALMNGAGSDSIPRPWDAETATAKASEREMDEAREILVELVHSLLAVTGAPGFREEFAEGMVPFEEQGEDAAEQATVSASPQKFTGFDPKTVHSEVLETSSKALRAGRGQILQEVLREFELRAIGFDGTKGDSKDEGGGHYLEVKKISAFLEGYRKAEVRRIARETTKMLLFKLMNEGIQGLDFMMAGMVRNSDDTGEAGELNDALVDYLTDAIREQERKVEDWAKTSGSPHGHKKEEDHFDNIWKREVNAAGDNIEALDPSNPETARVMNEAYEGEDIDLPVRREIPESAPQKVLLLLKTLRDRIRAEAVFANDEHGRNLRTLAYCLQFEDDSMRKKLIDSETKNSLERLESFMELVVSAMDYAESTAYQLGPAKTSKQMNVKLLLRIYDFAKEIEAERVKLRP